MPGNTSLIHRHQKTQKYHYGISIKNRLTPLIFQGTTNPALPRSPRLQLIRSHILQQLSVSICNQFTKSGRWIGRFSSQFFINLARPTQQGGNALVVFFKSIFDFTKNII